ncbi:aminoglycoside 6-adenylyltransferase [Clostridium sp. HCS.1]|uniref:aminoglycoside 6-adenylyltransferase n=1 Tax=Clostridium sp. HCS.1 TaxID=3238594 RepID=UPI003A102CF5
MITSKIFYENMERDFVSWAQTVEDIRAAFIVGSRARNDHPADQWSDMDIIFFTSRQNYYLSNNQWLNNMGEICTSFVSQTEGGDHECLTLFNGGWQVDFVIHSLDDLRYIVNKKITPDNFYRGVKVLIDKDNVANYIMPQYSMAPKGNILSEEKFLQSINMFWFIALYTAKQILRNELWVVKVRDNNMKELLLQMIEWHEKTVNGSGYDTWHAGRFLCEWASKETQIELQNSFGHFERIDSWKALMATINLFKRLSHDISQKKKFSYPYAVEKSICDWINKNREYLG